MRGWARTSAAAAVHVADRPALWLPGALAWVLTVGWLVMLVAVARPPSTADLTFLGAGLYTSGGWPWNLAGAAAVALLIVAASLGLVAVAEARLQRGPRATPDDVRRLMVLGAICALPAVIAFVVLAAGFVFAATIEFNSPQDGGGPVVRSAARVLPLMVGVVVVAVIGAAIHAAAARRALDGDSILASLRAAPARLARVGGAGLAQAVTLIVTRLAFATLAAVLLRVMWAPIEQRLALDGIDAAAVLLLVGFVAIWLCLVLAGGALHAWGSISWTGVLGAGPTDRRPTSDEMETPSLP